ncbi:MAG: hypothetical protein JSV51_04690 [Candidatus Bathyarchaeota archaeon]|nr:MAG: hypothetical protein JSV51_04690 [Candidatus Bathyarchaeota archaeon]
MYKKQWVNQIGALLIILLTLTFFTTWTIPHVSAEVSISLLSEYAGGVGDLVRLTGQINTTDGAYEILFDGLPVQEGNATLTTVEDSFLVPNSTEGDHTVSLRDIEANITSTALNFIVRTEYIVKAAKPYYQEGENATILAIITGGKPISVSSANITVVNPAKKDHSCPTFNITTRSDGYGEINKTYPKDFNSDPHTFFVGTYNITLNITGNKTLGTFTVGLTDALEYHRFQVVNTKAVNYTLPTDIMQVTIAYNGKAVFTSSTINASESGGVINANWMIPANASMGVYLVNVTRITPLGTEKPVPENQTFVITPKSFTCEVKAINLDNEPVKGITVEANDTFTSIVSINTTNKDGLTFFYLEATNYTFTAFLNNSQVSTISEIRLASNFTGNSAINITCSLANINVALEDADGNMLPFASVSANFTYTTRTNTTIKQLTSTETNLTGIATLRNLFINTNYTIRAGRYNQPFKTTTINLTSTTWFNATAPTLELIVKALDRNKALLQNAQVNVYDWGIGLSGLVGTESTGPSGEVAFNLTFGKYIVHVSKDEVLLNKTSTLLINSTHPTNFIVYCKLYNLTLDINVLDYFGQGIPNANITLEREGITLSSSNTREDGIARFVGLIGGNYRIFVYIDQRPYRTTTLNFQEPRTVETHNLVTLKIAEIVSIGGFITETSHFVTAALILSLAIVGLFVFIHHRLRSSQEKE